METTVDLYSIVVALAFAALSGAICWTFLFPIYPSTIEIALERLVYDCEGSPSQLAMEMRGYLARVYIGGDLALPSAPMTRQTPIPAIAGQNFTICAATYSAGTMRLWLDHSDVTLRWRYRRLDIALDGAKVIVRKAARI